MSNFRVFNHFKFSASSGITMLHVGDKVHINLSAAVAKKQKGGSKKKTVLGEILGFVKFCHLPSNVTESFGQGYVWYRQVPLSVYGKSMDTEHVVKTACLDLAKGDGIRVTETELERVCEQAPSMVRVEVLHRPNAARSGSSTPAVSQKGKGGDDEAEKRKEIFQEGNVEDVSNEEGFELFAAEPVDITVTVLSGNKKLVLHRPNDPSKKYSVHLHAKEKDFGKSTASMLFTKKVDRASKSVSFDRFGSEDKATEKNDVVHYYKDIQFNRSDGIMVTLYLDVMDGSHVVFSKQFLVKVSASCALASLSCQPF